MRERVRSRIKSRPGDICIFWVILMSSKSDLFFTHCGIVMRYADIDLAHNWPRWWLLAWWLQSITRTWWTSLHQWGLLAFTWGQFQRKCWTISILDIIQNYNFISLIWIKNYLPKITTTSLREQWVNSLFRGCIQYQVIWDPVMWGYHIVSCLSLLLSDQLSWIHGLRSTGNN